MCLCERILPVLFLSLCSALSWLVFLFACSLGKAIEKEGMRLLYGWEGGEYLEEMKETVS